MSDDSNNLFEPSDSDPQAEALPVQTWLAEVSGPDWLWYVKRLSANDTLLNRSHQYGPYLPKTLVRLAFPEVTARYATEKNPDAWPHFILDSHGFARDVRLIWYNSRVMEEGGTRDEARITQWGGTEAPILDPEATGSLCVFAFALESPKDSSRCRAWLCEGAAEAIAVQDVVGPVEPGEGLLYSPTGMVVEEAVSTGRPCWLTDATMPPAWRTTFPSAAEIVGLAIRNAVSVSRKPTAADMRLLVRRDCEYAIFRSVEQAHVLPRIQGGFRAVDIFVDYANAVTNRRKSRAGASLELHAHHIFTEDGLAHEREQVTEGKKRPDFLFPSAAAYHDPSFPAGKLRMLAAKTTCKDRWRQVINEANRITVKHLLTLQEGVSPNQWKEMHEHGVSLVVPKPLHQKFPDQVQPHLLTLADFIARTGVLYE